MDATPIDTSVADERKRQTLAYIGDMLVQLSNLATGIGETNLAKGLHGFISSHKCLAPDVLQAGPSTTKPH